MDRAGRDRRLRHALARGRQPDPFGTKGSPAGWSTPSLVETRFSPDALVWVAVVFHGTAAWRNHGLIISAFVLSNICPAALSSCSRHGRALPAGRSPRGGGHLLVGHPRLAPRVPRAGRG